MPYPGIMVTGGAGFIGSNLVRFLLQETKHEVANVGKLKYAGNLYLWEDIANAVCAGSKRNVIFCHDSVKGEEVENRRSIFDTVVYHRP